MTHWDGALGQAKMAKITQKHPYLWRSPPEKLKPKTKTFLFYFDYEIFWIWRGLNSSLAQSPGALQDCKALQEKWRTQDLKG